MGADWCELFLGRDCSAPIGFLGSQTDTVGKNFKNKRLSELYYTYIGVKLAIVPEKRSVGHVPRSGKAPHEDRGRDGGEEAKHERFKKIK